MAAQMMLLVARQRDGTPVTWSYRKSHLALVDVTRKCGLGSVEGPNAACGIFLFVCARLIGLRGRVWDKRET